MKQYDRLAQLILEFRELREDKQPIPDNLHKRAARLQNEFPDLKVAQICKIVTPKWWSYLLETGLVAGDVINKGDNDISKNEKKKKKENYSLEIILPSGLLLRFK